MDKKFNHRIAFWQLFFKWDSLLKGLLYSVFCFFAPFLYTPNLPKPWQYNIYNYHWYVFIFFICLGYIIQSFILFAPINKYGYSIGDTYISIFEGKLDYSWNISKSQESRFFYKDIKEVLIKQDLIGKLANMYLLVILPNGQSITPELKIKSVKGTIYGLTKTEAEKITTLLSEKIKATGKS